MLKYQKEIDRLERAYNTHFNTLWNMVSKAKFALMRRFFETIASRVKHVYDIANRDVDSWLHAVMAPLETQVQGAPRCSCAGASTASSASTARAASSRSAWPSSNSRERGARGAAARARRARWRRSTSVHRGSPTLLPLAPTAECPSRGPLSSVRRAALGRHQPFVLELQRILRLDVVRVDRDAVDRADLDALRRVEMPDALGAFLPDR